jgi:hypothetical protein
MRSSKSRSRKSGRNNAPNRSVGNIINRVFDSSGPEGKVRGTPQQIIDKYNQLARDAQLSNDRVAMENFQQHAEHYLRLLAEAQREIDQRREQQERENRDRQSERDQSRDQTRDTQRDQNRDGQRDQNRDHPRDTQRDQNRDPQRDQNRDRPARTETEAQPAPAVAQEVLDLGGDSGLVDTPESRAEQPAFRSAPQDDAAQAPRPAPRDKPAPRAKAEPKPKPAKASADAPATDAAAAEAKPKPRSRAPRKPRETGAAPAKAGDTPEAAE